MATKNYTTRTASLRATIADVRVLDAKKMNLDGKNILDYIKDSVPTIKHSQDTRETITDNDLWGQWVETKSDGTIVIHDDWVTNPNDSNYKAWDSSIIKVEDNKAYTDDTTYKNIQTEKIKDGNSMFYSCDNLISFSSDLSSLTKGYYMFFNCNKLTSFSSDSSGSPVNLSSLTNGNSMFEYCTNLTTFSSDLSSLTNGNSMFYNCDNLTTFSSDLSSLTEGEGMFYSCDNLISFSSDLSSLTCGISMFRNCTTFRNFSSDLSSLTNGYNMFYSCDNLTTFSSDLSSLTNGYYMFSNTNLISFSSDLSSLTNGNGMFYNCNNLISFSSDLSSLTCGISMFSSCKLDAESVMYIADTIKDIAAEKQLYIDGTIPLVIYNFTILEYSAPKGFTIDDEYVYTYNNPRPTTTTISASLVGKLTLGINVTNNADTIQQQLEDFAQEATFDSWADLKTYFSNKGWTVTFQYGGTTTNITLSEDEQFRGVPVYARLIEVSDEDKDKAEYCTEDGTKFYNIDWGHDVTDYDAYQYFGSLLEACGYYGVIPKKYLEEQA